MSTTDPMIVWLVETLHYPFDFAFPDAPPPVDHDALADYWNAWDGWEATPDEARSVIREEAGLDRHERPGGPDGT